MELKNIGTRAIKCDNKWLKPGEVMTVKENGDWQDFVHRGLAEVYGVKLTETPGNLYLKEDLDKMKMSELRKIGEKMGAKDTDKQELIEEILRKQG